MAKFDVAKLIRVDGRHVPPTAGACRSMSGATRLYGSDNTETPSLIRPVLNPLGPPRGRTLRALLKPG